jgi:hypothetical protein
MKIHNFESSIVTITLVFLYLQKRRLNLYKGYKYKRIIINKTGCLSLIKNDVTKVQERYCARSVPEKQLIYGV